MKFWPVGKYCVGPDSLSLEPYNTHSMFYRLVILMAQALSLSLENNLGFLTASARLPSFFSYVRCPCNATG